MRSVTMFLVWALLVQLVLPTISVAQERSIYNRLGKEARITLTPVNQQSQSYSSPALEENEKWDFNLPSGEYEVKLELLKEQQSAVARLAIDPRLETTSLLSFKTSTAVPEKDPVTGETKFRIIERENYRFVSGPRFGVSFSHDAQGIRILSVDPHMPATRCKDANGQTLAVEVDDHIVSINGVLIESQAQMSEAVAKSPREMRFTVVDRRTGQSRELKTNLAY